ncbi:hypothetical protein FRC17_004217, partial [Serendipita sp. 399]
FKDYIIELPGHKILHAYSGYPWGYWDQFVFHARQRASARPEPVTERYLIISQTCAVLAQLTSNFMPRLRVLGWSEHTSPSLVREFDSSPSTRALLDKDGHHFMPPTS